MFDELKIKVENGLTETLKDLRKKNLYSDTKLFDAMDYSIMNGGKRLRPVMLLASNRLCGGDIDEAMPLAAALEIIHSYSLVHDDLPCMDNDILRRGKNTTHVEYGEAMALLAGDGLLNLAFEVMLEGSFKAKNLKNYNKAMKSIAFYSGYNGMVGGQAIDIEFSKDSNLIPDKDLILKMYQGKTSALFIAAVTAGAICGGANDRMISDLTSFAFNLGIAFQIQDDILDVESDEIVLGKKTGRDDENDKMTVIRFCGLDDAKKLCLKYQENALKYIEKYKNNEELLEIFNLIIQRKK